MNVIDRIEKLMALATSPNENEARNAAYKAVQLIREHKVAIGVRDFYTVPPPPPKTTFRTRTVIVSKYPGLCMLCMEHYKVGDSVAYAKGRGAIHDGCWDRQS